MSRKKAEAFNKSKVLVFSILVAVLSFILYFTLPKIFAVEYKSKEGRESALANQVKSVSESGNDAATSSEEISHIKTPDAVKAIYMSACYAGNKTLREKLVKLIDDTELDAVVIDIKDYSGKISFLPNDSWKSFLSDKCNAPDMQDFIKELHEKNIYVIGRITTFQDPFFANLHKESAVSLASNKSILWKDRKGINYMDPGSRVAADHIVALAKDSYNSGFDEINFDYIRFPSDGNMKDIYFPVSEGKNKAVVMEDFYKYLSGQLKPLGVVLSADLFGMVTTNTDDLNGQVLERALPYFDYIAPMVYPSHFPPTFHGWADPNKHAYDLINFTMGTAVKRTIATTTTVATFDGEKIASTTPQLYTKTSWDKLKMRPWLQDFNYGGIYGVPEVKAQMQATYDVGLTSWMLWSPSNRYTAGALLLK